MYQKVCSSHGKSDINYHKCLQEQGLINARSCGAQDLGTTILGASK